MFWTFRVMAGLGFVFIGLFALAFALVTFDKVKNKAFLALCILAIPLPWIAIEGGWLLAELGRQPWAVDGVLPTFMGASSLTTTQIWITIAGFTLMYGVMAIIEISLMVRAIKKGPYVAKFGRMHDDAPLAPAE